MKKGFFSLKIVLLIFIYSFFICFSSTQTPSLLQQACPNRPVPEKFGILTTTYIRLNSTSMINGYLKRYAESDCDIYDNIYIVWNNEETPEEMGVLKNSHKWKKNVYFMQTVENSLDFKYIVPTWAKEKVFFGMDDDFDITCETFKSAFSSWQKSSYGEVGPLTSFYARSYVFEPQTQSFSYIDQVKLNPNWSYYHFGLTGIAFISRHFLEMYYSDLFQLKEMRKLVVEKNNCEDLLMNFMVGYLYPELITDYLKVSFKSLGLKGVSTTKSHRQYRAQCITRFTQILGFNPIRFVKSKKNQTLIQKKTPINENCLVNLKQQHFEKNFINNKAYYMYIKAITGVDNDFIKDENKKLIEAKKDIQAFMKKRKEQIHKLRNDSKSEISTQPGMSETDKKMLQETEMAIHFGTDEQISSYMNKREKISISEPKQQSSNSKSKNVLSSDQKTFQTQNPQSQTPLSSTQAQYIIYLVIFSSIILSILCIKKIIDTRNSKYYTVPQSVSTEL